VNFGVSPVFIFTNLVNETAYAQLALTGWKTLAEFYSSSNVKQKSLGNPREDQR